MTILPMASTHLAVDAITTARARTASLQAGPPAQQAATSTNYSAPIYNIAYDNLEESNLCATNKHAERNAKNNGADMSTTAV